MALGANRYINIVSGQLTQVAPTTISVGAGSAGQIIALNSAGAIDPTMLPSGVGPDAVIVTAASGGISAGQLVNLYNNSGLYGRPADATTPTQAHGFAPAAISAGQTGTVYAGPGIITGLTGVTIGAAYYLSTAGGITTTAPSTAGNIIQQVGVGLSTTSIEFFPSSPTVTVA